MLGFKDNHQQLEVHLDENRKLAQKHEHKHYPLAEAHLTDGSAL